MGNVLSDETEEREETFLQNGFNLESPDADKQINFGTAAPIWQNSRNKDEEDDDAVCDRNDNPNQTRSDPSQQQQQQQGQEVVMQRQQSSDKQSSTKAPPPTDPKKLSYLQMAKLGYQELVNAIIRPPRADYKVSLLCCRREKDIGLLPSHNLPIVFCINSNRNN